MAVINTYTLDLNNLVFKSKEVIGDWEYLICENEGSFTEGCQSVTFDCDGNELVVCFELSVSGRLYEYAGDYWTPSSSEVDITDVDVDITDIYFNDNKLILNKELNRFLMDKVKSVL